MLKEKVRNLFIHAGFYSYPDFVVIGAQKAGTSALFSMLSQHPSLTPSHRKEVNYFGHDQLYNNDKNYVYYYSMFPLSIKVPKGNLVFEATPYYIYHPHCAVRLYRFNPSLQLIAILREPAERAFSAWRMYNNFKNHPVFAHLYEPRSFREAIEEEIEQITHSDWYKYPLGYVKRGIYYEQLQRYYDYFPPSQILILDYGELKALYPKVLTNIFSFLNIPFQELHNQELNKGKGNPQEDYQEEMEMLKSFYKPYNEKLFSLLGKRLNWIT
jgi:hypothetical protein